MEEIKLEVKVMNGEVQTNAKELMEIVEAGLKHYDYVVTEENYTTAKADRTALNTLVKQIADERKATENRVFNKWKTEDKPSIMAIENKIREVSDKLGSGVNSIDEEEKKKSYLIYKDLWESMEHTIPYEKVHDKRYLNKSFKDNDVKKDLEAKFSKIENDRLIIQTLIPDSFEMAEKISCENAYNETLDLARVQAEVRRITINKQMAEEMKRKQEEAKRMREQEVASYEEQQQANVQGNTFTSQINANEAKKQDVYEQEWILEGTFKGTRAAMQTLYSYMEQLGIEIINKKWSKA